MGERPAWGHRTGPESEAGAPVPVHRGLRRGDARGHHRGCHCSPRGGEGLRRISKFPKMDLANIRHLRSGGPHSPVFMPPAVTSPGESSNHWAKRHAVGLTRGCPGCIRQKHRTQHKYNQKGRTQMNKASHPRIGTAVVCSVLALPLIFGSCCAITMKHGFG